MSEPTPNAEKKISFSKLIPWIILLLVVIGAGLYANMAYKKSQNLEKQITDMKANPEKAAQNQTKDLLDKVGKLIVLPENEQPTVAVVADLDPLKGQAFFANAKLGDKVLIYTIAKKGILYRESENKIIEVAPLNLDGAAGTQQAAPAGTTPAGTQQNKK